MRGVIPPYQVILQEATANNHHDILNTIQLAFTIIYDQMTRMLGKGALLVFYRYIQLSKHDVTPVNPNTFQSENWT